MVSREGKGGSDKQRGRGMEWQIVRKGKGERKVGREGGRREG